MFSRNYVDRGTYPGRYTRSVDGRESWSARPASGPRDEMIARYSSPCGRCGMPITAGVTVIRKISGSWGHKECPEAPARKTPETTPTPAKIIAALEPEWQIHEALSGPAPDMSPDAADRLLDAYAAELRARNLVNMKPGTYRIEFSGRADTDALNLKITPDRKIPGAFRFKKHESYESAGRVYADGRVQFWSNTALMPEDKKRAGDALEILLGAGRPGKYGESYARETGACWRCGRDLKVEASIDRGMGAYCASQVEAGY